MSKDFHWAFDLRQSSDYHVTAPLSDSDALDLMERGRRFVARVAEHLEKRYPPASAGDE